MDRAGPLTDCSGGCTGQSFKFVDQNSFRKCFMIQNLNNTLPLYLNFGSPATDGLGSFRVGPGGFLSFADAFNCTDAIYVLGAPGVSFTAKVG